MKGRIIGPPIPVVVGDVFRKVRLSVAVETEYHMCAAALLPPDVFPTLGLEVRLRIAESISELFDFYIVKE